MLPIVKITVGDKHARKKDIRDAVRKLTSDAVPFDIALSELDCHILFYCSELQDVLKYVPDVILTKKSNPRKLSTEEGVNYIKKISEFDDFQHLKKL